MEFRLQQGRNPGRLTPRSSLPAVCPKGPPWALTNANLCRGLLATGAGRPSSIEPAFSIRVVERPFHAQRGGEFLGLLTSVEGGKPKVAGQACCSDLVSALYLELSPGVVKPLG